MPQKRFSIAGLMGFVLILALGFGGLKAANPLWASSFYTLAFASLCAGVLLAIQTRGKGRAFWTGFAVAGWTYFVFAFTFPSSQSYEPPPQLLTVVLLEKVETLFFPGYNRSFSMIFTPPQVPVPIPPAPPVSVPPSTTTNVLPPTTVTVGADSLPLPIPPNSPAPPIPIGVGTQTPIGIGTPVILNVQSPQVSFHHVGQSLTLLILAYIGGLFSLFLAARRERSEAAPTSDVSPSSP